jgi:hypothetical protein
MCQKYHIASLLVLIGMYCGMANAQDKSNHEYYMQHYTGCWKTESAEDGQLITRSDNSFLWIKGDTLKGTWHTRARNSIPFKTTIIVLKFKTGDKEKYEIGVISRPAAIYLPDGHTFLKTGCN